MTGPITTPAVMTYSPGILIDEGYTVNGPGNGIGYYSGYLHPENILPTWEEAERTARLMNIAFKEGQRAKATEIRNALEIDQ